MSAVASEATTLQPTGRPTARWLILAVICLAQLTVILDNTVLNVAIPSLTGELGATTADVQWMINAYSLVQSGLLLTAGNAADRYGRKKMLAAGLVLFGLASLGATLAQSPGQLIAARAGMGVGGALLVTTTLAVVMQIFDDAERPKAIGIWSSVNSLAFVAGPLVGGSLLDHFWWGALFLVNLPVAVMALAAVVALVPESGSRGGERPDLPGALLSMIGMGGVVFAIISGPQAGWLSGRVLVSAAVGAVGLAAFVLWELYVPYPMLDMHFFRNRRFIGAVSGGILVAFGMGGSLFLLTQHLQLVLGYGPLDAGLRMAPLAVTVILINFTGLGARLMPKVGTPGMIISGMSLLAAGLAAIALLGGHSYPGLLTGLIVMGIGIALAMPTMANAIMSAIPPAKAGVGAGVNGTLMEFGTGLGVAVLGAVLNSRFVALLPLVAAGAGSLPAALARTRTGAERAAVQDAFAAGIGVSQLAGAAAVFLGGLLAALLLSRAERAGREQETAAAPSGPEPASAAAE
ncbi:EmrB/QacA subfamily drug resistance transporter [Streptomyces sp. 2333.5]|uniref:MFS transporter n=1 Tax=unclassified Streptomyces TaxID=2593676 RepID=UPI00089C70CB|nr:MULTISPECIES: MFS transporter [unclassified Streptomyces]PJJ03330.1 EmrB/QacA subfamily drug resistance transporter [Streptomyces sp. 2333.5]SED47618.1 drug resistance transporter, EmrB/QacA subfamily [Streptomyces sp. 2314.4]SEE41023.1 drug resistance transporter, EmrB/QacA subfamily [Streptomyces sp. 2112.2]